MKEKSNAERIIDAVLGINQNQPHPLSKWACEICKAPVMLKDMRAHIREHELEMILWDMERAQTEAESYRYAH